MLMTCLLSSGFMVEDLLSLDTKLPRGLLLPCLMRLSWFDGIGGVWGVTFDALKD